MRSCETRYNASLQRKSNPQSFQGDDAIVSRLLEAVADIRAAEISAFSTDPNSRTGLGLAQLRIELQRAMFGLPVRIESLVRALVFSTGGARGRAAA